MKNAYFTTGLYTGGAEMMLYHLLSKMNRERFSPVVLSLMDGGTLSDRIAALGIPVYTIGMKPGLPPTPAALWRLLHIVHHLKPDLIQGWMYHGNLAALLVSIFSFHKIPVLWGIHHSINSLQSEKKMTAMIINFSASISKWAEKIIYVSHNSKIQHEAINYCCKNSCIIPNGFDTSLFKPSLEARLNLRSELGLSNESFLIGLICRYHPMKDHANFLRAAALLLKNFPNVHFVLAGTDVNQENPGLQQLIKELGIVNNIHLLGERKDMPRLTAALDIATSSSAFGEAFPLVIGEAMSCGVPCVVTDIGDSAWIVGNTGRVIPPQNSEALAKAWQELILLDAESKEALGKAARARIIESFSLETVVTQYEKLYESVLTKKFN
ncbi:glycosyltransferase family 4 protein [Iningainema tapete]|uniref:Glycosyltransferase n=1 Tax=Iningainema tapete BLCC-T55 TaxID=2748662 RepID=A0A8J7C7J3_9CYAN|nr:glycosyltransferase [Iningainema tapete]MBD2773236.1 glycosyltransferase [Iningainema tapete BLCC-T55]